MNREFTASFAALIFTVAGMAQAATVVPAFNLTGNWASAGGGTASYFQEGTQLNFLSVGPDYAHTYTARYITPTKAEGIQHRVTRANGCSTEMLLTLTATDNNHLSTSAKALDSNCDLVKGQIYTDTATRIQ